MNKIIAFYIVLGLWAGRALGATTAELRSVVKLPVGQWLSIEQEEVPGANGGPDTTRFKFIRELRPPKQPQTTNWPTIIWAMAVHAKELFERDFVFSATFAAATHHLARDDPFQLVRAVAVVMDGGATYFLIEANQQKDLEGFPVAFTFYKDTAEPFPYDKDQLGDILNTIGSTSVKEGSLAQIISRLVRDSKEDSFTIFSYDSQDKKSQGRLDYQENKKEESKASWDFWAEEGTIQANIDFNESTQQFSGNIVFGTDISHKLEVSGSLDPTTKVLKLNFRKKLGVSLRIPVQVIDQIANFVKAPRLSEAIGAAITSRLEDPKTENFGVMTSARLKQRNWLIL